MKNLHVLVLAWLAVATPALAQAPGGSVAPAGPPPTPGWKFQAAANVAWMTGNVDIFQVQGNFALGYEVGLNNFLLSATLTYAHQGPGVSNLPDTDTAAQVGSHFHYRRTLIPWLAVEVFCNQLYDRFAGFDVQIAAGPNVVFLYRNGPFQLDVGLGYLFEYEQYGPVAGTLDGTNDIAHRGQLYLFIQYALAPNLQVLERIFYMPRFDGVGPEDYQITNALTLQVQLSTHLQFQTSFNLTYDDPPPGPTEKLNTQLMTGLTVMF